MGEEMKIFTNLWSHFHILHLLNTISSFGQLLLQAHTQTGSPNSRKTQINTNNKRHITCTNSNIINMNTTTNININNNMNAKPKDADKTEILCKKLQEDQLFAPPGNQTNSRIKSEMASNVPVRSTSQVSYRSTSSSVRSSSQSQLSSVSYGSDGDEYTHEEDDDEYIYEDDDEEEYEYIMDEEDDNGSEVSSQQQNSMNTTTSLQITVHRGSSDQGINQNQHQNHHQFDNHTQHSTLPLREDVTWNFVKSIIDKHNQISSSSVFPSNINTKLTIEPIGIDVMYDVAKRMFECQEEFLKNETPVEVSLAYHYTRDSCVDSIAEQGLNTSKSGTYGAGVYLGNNACAFHGRANVGLIVAILKGKCECIGGRPSHQNMTINTRIGNKSSYKNGPFPNYYDEIVLQDSRQCVPLIKFNSLLVDPSGSTEGAARTNSNECIWIYHREMQKIVDRYYNGGVTIGERVAKSDIFPGRSKKYSTLLQLTIPSPSNEISATTAGVTTPATNIVAMEQYEKEMYHHNLPIHFFEEEKRDDAVAYLLKSTSKSTSTTIALKLAGFVDFEASDPILQKNVEEYLTILRKRSASMSSKESLYNKYHTIKTHEAVKDILKNPSSTIRSAMKKATFTDRNVVCVDQRYKVLECLAIELYRAQQTHPETKAKSETKTEQIEILQAQQKHIDDDLKLWNAAHLLVTDITVSKTSALMNAGYSFTEAQDPSLQLKAQKVMCEIALKVGVVGSSLSTPVSNDTENSSNNGTTVFPFTPGTKNSIPNSNIHSNEIISKLNQAAASLSNRDTVDIPSIVMAMEDAGLTMEEATDSRNQIHVKIKANFIKTMLTLTK